MDGNIFQKGVLVQLSISIWTGRVKIDPRTVSDDADPEYLSVTKFLIDKNYLNPLEQIRSEVRHYIGRKSLPFDITGVLFIPAEILMEVDEELKRMKSNFQEKVCHFTDQYKYYVDMAEARLGRYFRPEDYP